MSAAAPAPAGFAASIFDMDGLLIDSEVLWHEAEIEILGGLGVPLDPTGCRTTKGMFVGEVTAHWHGHYPWAGPGARARWRWRSSIGSSSWCTPKACSSPAPSTPSNSVPDRGWALAVASSSQYRLIDAALDHFGLRDRFELVHSAEDEESGKPHPAVFFDGRRQAAGAARRCLVWEDAPAGVLAAKAASMACIAVPEEGEGGHPAFGLADLVVGSLAEVDEAALDGVARRHFGP